jgi:transketolase
MDAVQAASSGHPGTPMALAPVAYCLWQHLASLRAIPGLITLRPGDANEVLEAWKVVVQLKHEPVALILSRQAMPTLDRTKFAPAAGL